MNSLPRAEGRNWAARLATSSTTHWYRGLFLPLLLLAVWELATRYQLVNAHLVVRPGLVLKRAAEELREGDLVGQLAASLQRDLLGFSIGALTGLLTGAGMGLSRTADRLFSPSFNAAKQVALFAWLPLISLWLGTGETAKVAFIGLAAFYPVVVNTYEGVQSVHREHIEVAKVFGFTSWQVLRKLVLPGAAPSIFAGLHLGLMYAWLGTLGAEYLLEAGAGVGNLMIDGREQLAMDKVILGMILAGAVGFALNSSAAQIESRVLQWRVRSPQ